MKGWLRKLEKKIRKIYFKWIEEKNVQKSGTGTGKKCSIDYTCKITFLASWSHPVTVRVIKKFSQFSNFQSNENISIEMVEKKNSYQSKQNNLDMKNDSQGWKKKSPVQCISEINLWKFIEITKIRQVSAMPYDARNTNSYIAYEYEWDTAFSMYFAPYLFPRPFLSLTSSLPLLLLSLHPLSSSLSRAMVIFQIKCETANC